MVPTWLTAVHNQTVRFENGSVLLPSAAHWFDDMSESLPVSQLRNTMTRLIEPRKRSTILARTMVKLFGRGSDDPNKHLRRPDRRPYAPEADYAF
jgi:hypothetical protein